MERPPTHHHEVTSKLDVRGLSIVPTHTKFREPTDLYKKTLHGQVWRTGKKTTPPDRKF